MVCPPPWWCCVQGACAVPCCSRRCLSRCKHCSKAAQVPVPNLSQLEELGLFSWEKRRQDGYHKLLKVLFCRRRIRSALWEPTRWNGNYYVEVRVRHFCSLYGSETWKALIFQTCSEEKCPLQCWKCFSKELVTISWGILWKKFKHWMECWIRCPLRPLTTLRFYAYVVLT